MADDGTYPYGERYTLFVAGGNMGSSTLPPAAWHPDPTGRYEQRYWDGAEWTAHVHSGTTQSVDPLPVTVEASGQADAVESTAPETPPTAQAASLPARAAPASPKVPFFGARKAAQSAQTENARLQRLIDEHGLRDLADRTAALEELDSTIAARQLQLDAIGAEVARAEAARDEIAAQIVDLRTAVSLQEFGLYDYENPAESSVALATELEGLRSEIKQAVSSGRATTATSSFLFNNSAAKGAKFVRDMSKLMLRSYNAEAENCVKAVRAGNLATAQKRLTTAAEQVARLGSMIDLKIAPQYRLLRLRELALASRHLQALQVEKELERERREELRQQRLAEQELAREKERLEKERSHYTNVIAALVEKGDVEGAERIRMQLEDVEKAIADVDYRAANIRAGYVYVISNIGSFGPDVVKIGLTRRLDPMDRVNELGDASVPFRFDVHALFFAHDAVSIEATLHRHFAEQRLNRVNLRREYFRATPEDVLEALRQHNVEVLEFVLEPPALEYRTSQTPEPASAAQGVQN